MNREEINEVVGEAVAATIAAQPPWYKSALIWVGPLVVFASIVASWAILGHSMQRVEKRLEKVEAQMRVDSTRHTRIALLEARMDVAEKINEARTIDRYTSREAEAEAKRVDAEFKVLRAEIKAAR